MTLKTTSDGSTASYYELPAGATELQHLISHRNMNSQVGEIFRACYRYGLVEHSPEIRDIKKILFYAKAELERLEKLAAPVVVKWDLTYERPAPKWVIDEPGWMPHDGRVMPATLRDEQIVEVMFAGIGQAHRRGQAQSYIWEWDKTARDQWQILAYRLV